jgi:alcohol dehydrogenase
VADRLALRGLAAARDGLLVWHELAVAGLGGAAASAGPRAAMATAALCSGICLAQTGLGAVHGVASPLGALFPIPHGVACGSTLAAATRLNVAALELRGPENPALARYAELGRLLAGTGKAPATFPHDGEARAALVQVLDDWRARLAVPRLSAYGITAADIPAIVADSRGSSMKTNPIVLTDSEIAAILAESL